MKKWITTTACLLAAFFATAQVTVFESGTEGYKSFRIPTIIRLPDGHLLAFAEGRVGNASDFGDIDIVMKRSTDKGNTWSALQVVAENKDLQAGNPAPVLDMSDPAHPGGRIFLFYNAGNNHESEVRKGNGLREAMYVASADGGKTWSEPVNITRQVHRPQQLGFTEDWRCFFNTPGHAMQFVTGPYKGRIFVATNHSAGDPQPKHREYRAGGYYSDDHGKTFHISEDVNIPGSNEAIATEISGGRLMMNVRNQQGNIKARIVALSSNGGASWDTAYFDMALPDPVCQGSILTVGRHKGKAIVAFSNAADTSKRDNLTLRISNNDGLTWKRSYKIDQTGQAGNAAYSDLVVTGKREIGVLYEKDRYKKILFTKVKWKK
ncbi:sialidase family protein [Chitinophaga alhagiae]|uniref:sialidase family protein n=1 Tax=Chitinophaga alhagiae TaxID=2203219 RepID=UPI000E5C4D01|nr:sialidase family protein [Chitinophaga alhagiae]